MNYIAQERNLVKNLAPFYMLCHFFEKYGKARPTTAMLVELWSKEPVVPELGTIELPPFDAKIKQIRIRSSDRDPNTVEELIFNFPKQEIHLSDFEQRFGTYYLDFDSETMISSFCFENFRSIYIDKICCRYHGKFTETAEGDFSYIHPETFERRSISRETLNFKSFALHFRKMGW